MGNITDVVVFFEEHNDNTALDGKGCATVRYTPALRCSRSAPVCHGSHRGTHPSVIVFSTIRPFPRQLSNLWAVGKPAKPALPALWFLQVIGAFRWREELCSSPPPYSPAQGTRLAWLPVATSVSALGKPRAGHLCSSSASCGCAKAWRVQEPSGTAAKLRCQEVTYSEPAASSGRRNQREKEDGAASCSLENVRWAPGAHLSQSRTVQQAAPCSNRHQQAGSSTGEASPPQTPPNRRGRWPLLHWLFSRA